MGQKIKSALKLILVLGLVLSFVLGDASMALAARSGGRIGGGGFRAPRPSAPPRSGGGYRSPGGGIGFPFLFPFFGFGGFGSLFTILIFFAIANFLINSFRNSGIGGSQSASNTVTVAEVKVGLLAQAKELQQELNQLAHKADTSTASGRASVLQEATLALLRHPEYWTYGAANGQTMGFEQAEGRFNQLSLSERSKYQEETLSNYNDQTREGTLAKTEGQDPGEYILVTLIVGATGSLRLPNINSADDLRQALREIGGVGEERLLAMEVIWQPQAEGDTLTADDLLAEYPNLKLV